MIIIPSGRLIDQYPYTKGAMDKTQLLESLDGLLTSLGLVMDEIEETEGLDKDKVELMILGVFMKVETIMEEVDRAD